MIVGSRISGSSGPRPNVSSSTSLTSRSRSLRLSRSELWRHSSSAARRTSSAQLLLVHRADGRQVHAGDQLLVQLLLEAEEPLLGRRQRAAVAASFAVGLAVGSSSDLTCLRSWYRFGSSSGSACADSDAAALLVLAVDADGQLA